MKQTSNFRTFCQWDILVCWNKFFWNKWVPKLVLFITALQNKFSALNHGFRLVPITVDSIHLNSQTFCDANKVPSASVRKSLPLRTNIHSLFYPSYVRRVFHPPVLFPVLPVIYPPVCQPVSPSLPPSEGTASVTPGCTHRFIFISCHFVRRVRNRGDSLSRNRA